MIYVGKARLAARRVLSYLDPARQLPQTVLLAPAAAVEWFETATEVEALILENR